MYDKLQQLTAKHISPLTIQGLMGRVLVHPSRKATPGREIIFIYGIHGSLERFYGIILYLSRFGRVTVPDLPGFGGMEPFSKLGKAPSLDNYADYLAAFIKEKMPPDQPITLIGLSFGFTVITRMFLRHPELTYRVSLTISAMGLSDGRDISIKWYTRAVCEILFWLNRTAPFSQIMQYVMTRWWLLKLIYHPGHRKMKNLPPGERLGFVAFEAYLWRANHMATYGACMHELFTLRQPAGAHISATLHHIGTAHDQWLNDREVQTRLGRLFENVVVHESPLLNHSGTAYAEEDEAREIIPPSVAKLLETV